MIRRTKRKFTRTLRFCEITDRDGRFVGGGIENTIGHIEEEVWVQFFVDRSSKASDKQPLRRNRLQLHLGGTRRAFEELGVFLVALSKYDPPRDGYSLSFDVPDNEGQPALHLVIHLPVAEDGHRGEFTKIHTVATARITRDGSQILSTDLKDEPRRRKK